MLEAQIYIEKHFKTEKIGGWVSRGGVSSPDCGGLYPPTGKCVKISLLHPLSTSVFINFRLINYFFVHSIPQRAVFSADS